MSDWNSKLDLAALVESRLPGHSLPQTFYVDSSVVKLDLDRIFKRQWVFVGHSCQIKKPGDFFTVTIGKDPLILICGDDGEIRALHNVCRHRGTLISREDCGRCGDWFARTISGPTNVMANSLRSEACMME